MIDKLFAGFGALYFNLYIIIKYNVRRNSQCFSIIIIKYNNTLNFKVLEYLTPHHHHHLLPLQSLHGLYVYYRQFRYSSFVTEILKVCWLSYSKAADSTPRTVRELSQNKG